MSAPAISLPGCVPTACQQTVPIVAHDQLAKGTFRLRLACPEIARQAIPGQFFMIREPNRIDPLLGRPFALYDTYLDAQGQPAGIEVVYLVVGKMTTLMSTWRVGDRAEIWGPLGNGFPLPPTGRLLLVAGGIGQTPFLAIAREALGGRQYGQPPRKPAGKPQQVTLCYGVRSQEYLAGLDDFASVGLDVKLATDNGTRGHHGYVTDLLRSQLDTIVPDTTVYCCGPEPMMHAVARLCAERNVTCYLSLETPMACGFGACFSCVTKVRQPDETWDYRRVCVEGPIFKATDLFLEHKSAG
ncbi:MAG: pyrK [Planctomycetaceae bacterium]|nr:pyrK [Planctomycetaceae bacterium]